MIVTREANTFILKAVDDEDQEFLRRIRQQATSRDSWDVALRIEGSTHKDGGIKEIKVLLYDL